MNFVGAFRPCQCLLFESIAVNAEERKGIQRGVSPLHSSETRQLFVLADVLLTLHLPAPELPPGGSRAASWRFRTAVMLCVPPHAATCLYTLLSFMAILKGRSIIFAERISDGSKYK
jgi:hypothetical protein